MTNNMQQVANGARDDKPKTMALPHPADPCNQERYSDNNDNILLDWWSESHSKWRCLGRLQNIRVSCRVEVQVRRNPICMDANVLLLESIASVGDRTRTMAIFVNHTTQHHNPLANFCNVCWSSPLCVILCASATHVRCGECVRLNVSDASVTCVTCEGLISVNPFVSLKRLPCRVPQ